MLTQSSTFKFETKHIHIMSDNTIAIDRWSNFLRAFDSMTIDQRMGLVTFMETQVGEKLYFKGMNYFYEEAGRTGDYTQVKAILESVKIPPPVFSNTKSNNIFTIPNIMSYIFSFLDTRTRLVASRITHDCVTASCAKIANYKVVITDKLASNVHDFQRYLCVEFLTLCWINFVTSDDENRIGKFGELKKISKLKSVLLSDCYAGQGHIWSFDNVDLVRIILSQSAPSIEYIKINNHSFVYAMFASIYDNTFPQLLTIKVQDCFMGHLEGNTDHQLIQLQQQRRDAEMCANHCPSLKLLEFCNESPIAGPNKGLFIQGVLNYGNCEEVCLSVSLHEYDNLDSKLEDQKCHAVKMNERLSIIIGNTACGMSIRSMASITAKTNCTNMFVSSPDLRQMSNFWKQYEIGMKKNDRPFRNLRQLSWRTSGRGRKPEMLQKLIVQMSKGMELNPKMQLIIDCKLLCHLPLTNLTPLLMNLGGLSVQMGKQSQNNIRSTIDVQISFFEKVDLTKEQWNEQLLHNLENNGWTSPPSLENRVNFFDTRYFKNVASVHFHDLSQKIFFDYPAWE